MIYSVVLVNVANRRSTASSDYWNQRVSRAQLKRYLSSLAEMAEKSERLKYKPTVIDDLKFFSRECGNDSLIVFVTDLRESEDEVIKRINSAARVLRGITGEKSASFIRTNFPGIVDPVVTSRFVIASVGESGVGKTSILHLLMGTPPPEEHLPTVLLNTEVLPNIRFANYDIMILDFGGQLQSQKLWDFSRADMAFLVSDSTLKNLVTSKGIMAKVQQEYPKLPIRVFANKQDLPNALDPSAIGKVMGVDVQSLVAVDLAYRVNLLKSLVHLLCEHFGLEVPDISPDALLRFNPA